MVLIPAILLSVISVWIIFGILLFLFFTALLKELQKQAEDRPELVPDLVYIYTVLEHLGIAGLLAACIMYWPWAVARMWKKWRED